jgi:hypothetical protein
VVADQDVRGELVRAANSYVPRTRSYRDAVRTAKLFVPRNCSYRETVDLHSLRADPSTPRLSG